MTRTLLSQRQNEVRDKVDFATFDSKGRREGLQVYTWEQDATLAPPDHSWTYVDIPVGHHFFVSAHVTRNGELYGASHRDHYFSTIEERSAWIAKRIQTGQVKALRRQVNG